jgi:hypothetical protein
MIKKIVVVEQIDCNCHLLSDCKKTENLTEENIKISNKTLLSS